MLSTTSEYAWFMAGFLAWNQTAFFVHMRRHVGMERC
jgi:hypothetical protein